MNPNGTHFQALLPGLTFTQKSMLSTTKSYTLISSLSSWSYSKSFLSLVWASKDLSILGCLLIPPFELEKTFFRFLLFTCSSLCRRRSSNFCTPFTSDAPSRCTGVSSSLGGSLPCAINLGCDLLLFPLLVNFGLVLESLNGVSSLESLRAVINPGYEKSLTLLLRHTRDSLTAQIFCELC